MELQSSSDVGNGLHSLGEPTHLWKVGRERYTVSQDPILSGTHAHQQPVQDFSSDGPGGNTFVQALSVFCKPFSIWCLQEAKSMDGRLVHISTWCSSLMSAWTPDRELPQSTIHGFGSIWLAAHHKSQWVSEQGVHQLSADVDFLYPRQFSRLHILEHRFKEETVLFLKEESVLLLVFLGRLEFLILHIWTGLVLLFRLDVEHRSSAGTNEGQGSMYKLRAASVFAVHFWRPSSKVIGVMSDFTTLQRKNVYQIYWMWPKLVQSQIPGVKAHFCWGHLSNYSTWGELLNKLCAPEALVLSHRS